VVRLRRVVPIVMLGAIVAVALLYLVNLGGVSKARGANDPLAPNFTLADIHGQNFTLSQYRNSSVVVIEFTSLSCSECQIVEKSLKTISTQYTASAPNQVMIVSVYIEPQFGDTIPALRTYQVQNNVTWTMAQDTPTLAVSNAYGVIEIPTVVIVDKQGHAVYKSSGAQQTSTLESTITSALAGTAPAIAIVTLSVFALAAIAGLSTFFSPCAFPMFPGYMSLFLGLNAGAGSGPPAAGPAYQRAVRRALAAGSMAALGMIIVFLLIGVALAFAAQVVNAYLPYLLVLVGAVLVALGLLLFTNLQYWRIVSPLQSLWQRIRGAPAHPPVVSDPSASGRALHLKLFSYGMGYAAAAAGCVAPVIFAAIFAGLALGWVDGIINIAIFSLTAALLMIGVTVALAVAGTRYVNLLKAYTPLIKKISAGALVIVGAYLVYFYYTAWVV
jgi:cytochrome c-type biogenesis protein